MTLPIETERLVLHRYRYDDVAESWRLMERLRMRREAYFRESHKVDGRWDEEFVYAILADE
jgi:hypothetical protein